MTVGATIMLYESTKYAAYIICKGNLTKMQFYESAFLGQLFIYYTRQTDIRGEIIFLKHSRPSLLNLPRKCLATPDLS